MLNSKMKNVLLETEEEKQVKTSHLLLFSSISFTSTCAYLYILLGTRGINRVPTPSLWNREEE